MRPLPPTLFLPAANPDPRLRLRRLAGRDIRPLHDACQPKEPFPRFRETWLRALARADRDLSVPIVALYDGELAGHAQLILYPHVAEIADVAVAPARRSQGIGRALIEVLLAIGRHLDLPRIEIGVLVNNERALALYRRLGFRDSREVRLPRQAERAIILEITLDGASPAPSPGRAPGE